MYRKPPPRTMLMPDHPINYQCDGAWLMGENRGATFFDSGVSGLNATYSHNGAAQYFTETPTSPGMRGGLAYRNYAPSAQQVISNSNYAPPSENFTVNFWLQSNAFHDYGPIFDQWNESGSLRSWFIGTFSDGKLYCYSSSDGAAFRFYNGDVAMVAGQIYMITVIYGASGEATLIYFNAVAQATSTGGTQAYSGLLTTAQPLRFGYSPVFAGNTFGSNAAFENKRIYRRKLALVDIQTLYNEPYIGYEVPSTLQYYFIGAIASATAGRRRQFQVVNV